MNRIEPTRKPGDRGLWVAEYSPEQRKFHIDTLAAVIAMSTEIVRYGSETDRWLLLGVFETSTEAWLACDSFRDRVVYTKDLYNRDSLTRSAAVKLGLGAKCDCGGSRGA